MSSSVHWKGRSMGLPLFCRAGGGCAAAGGAGAWARRGGATTAKISSPLDIARKGHSKLTTLLPVFFGRASNFTAQNPRLLIKSPLRQRAHSPLSPKRARYPSLVEHSLKKRRAEISFRRIGKYGH